MAAGISYQAAYRTALNKPSAVRQSHPRGKTTAVHHLLLFMELWMSVSTFLSSLSSGLCWLYSKRTLSRQTFGRKSSEGEVRGEWGHAPRSPLEMTRLDRSV